MTRVAAIAALALGLTARGAIAAGEDQITPATVAAIERWIAAVRNHAPGRRDPEVVMVSALTFDDRIELNAGMNFFLSFLRGKPDQIKTVAEKAKQHFLLGEGLGKDVWRWHGHHLWRQC